MAARLTRNSSSNQAKLNENHQSASTRQHEGKDRNPFELLAAEEGGGIDTKGLIEAALDALPAGNSGETKLAKSTIGDIVTAVVNALVPIITTVINNASTNITNTNIEKLKSNV